MVANNQFKNYFLIAIYNLKYFLSAILKAGYVMAMKQLHSTAPRSPPNGPNFALKGPTNQVWLMPMKAPMIPIQKLNMAAMPRGNNLGLFHTSRSYPPWRKRKRKCSSKMITK
jgi:hypothetical protein